MDETNDRLTTAVVSLNKKKIDQAILTFFLKTLLNEILSNSQNVTNKRYVSQMFTEYQLDESRKN